MKTVTLRHFGPRICNVRTQDAIPFGSTVDRIMIGIKNSLGVLNPADVSRIQAILAKYDGRPSTTNALGISSVDEGRRASEEVAAGVERIRSVNQANRDFWAARR